MNTKRFFFKFLISKIFLYNVYTNPLHPKIMFSLFLLLLLLLLLCLIFQFYYTILEAYICLKIEYLCIKHTECKNHICRNIK
jgi:hypothetical protein